MGKKSTPPPPDYAAAAQAQAAASKDTAQYNTELNRVNQVTPYGSLTWNQTTGPDGKPVWTQTVQLSPEQQALQNSQDKLSQGYLNTAQSSLDRISQAMGTPFDMSGIPDMQGAPQGGTSASVSTPFTSVTPGQLQLTGPDASRYQTAGLDVAALANLYGKAPTVSAASVGGGGNITSTFDTSGVRKLPGQIDDTSRKRVEEALMARLNPQYQADEQALRTRLLNSGIEVGSDAYNREMNNFSQRLNDARMQAVLAGGQEESRQVGLIQGLQGQEFNQAYQKGKFGQDAEIAMANNALQAGIANANNALQAQIANGNFSQRNASDRIAAILAAQGLNQQGAQQNFGMDLSSRTFGNAAQEAQFAQGLASAQFANNAADTATQRQLQIDQITNAMGLANANFNNQNRQQSIQEQAYLRSLPLNEANALRSGGQVQGPQFSSYYTGGQSQAAPMFDAAVAQGNYDMQAAAQQQSGFNALLGGLASLGGAGILKYSDPRLKSNVTRIGTHPLGIGLYEYDIFGKRERGVMSTEVRQVMPHAVVVGEDGFDRVNYSLLGGF
jgi:hypothetical protein